MLHANALHSLTVKHPLIQADPVYLNTSAPGIALIAVGGGIVASASAPTVATTIAKCSEVINTYPPMQPGTNHPNSNRLLVHAAGMEALFRASNLPPKMVDFVSGKKRATMLVQILMLSD
ncbi:MAG: hypothetical protein ABW096_16440 [Candidatus Thiodiazotropha sp.]